MEAFDRVHDLVRSTQANLPGFRLREKRVWWWWAIYYVGFMFLWKPTFMVNTWVTLGRDVFVPGLMSLGEDSYGDYATISHEAQHVYDRLEYEDWLCQAVWLDCDYGYAPDVIKWFAGLSWTWAYGFPQTLAPLAIPGALVFGWWGLLPLLALLPLPAPFRVWVELRGYMMTMDGWYEVTGQPPNTDGDAAWIKKTIDKQFMGWGYWRMAWRRKPIELYFHNVKRAIIWRHSKAQAERTARR